jgi:hypothetical protein
LLPPCSVRRPLPACSTAPLPLIGWARTTLSDRFERNAPSTTIALVCSAPELAPSPTVSVPAATWVWPV